MDSNCALRKTTTHPIQITLPNGAIIQSTHTAHLPFPSLPAQALEVHVFPDLKNHALLLIEVFCDAGCIVHFTNSTVQVKLRDKVILEGIRDLPGLWKIQAHPDAHANAAFTTPFKRKALTFLHASMFSPATQTWVKAIDNSHFRNWPIFTGKEVKAHLPKSIATAMGHLDQQRKNLRSTKPWKRPNQADNTEAINDTNPAQEQASNDGFVNVLEMTDPQEESYSDLTGRFPVHSIEGNLYVLALYLYDTNAILVEPLKSRSETDQLKAYKRIFQRIPAHLKPRIHMMDNEASKGLKDFLCKHNNMQYQLVPPHIH
jgi:hypothetical protein